MMTTREFAKEFLGVGLAFPVKPDEMTGRIRTSFYEQDIQEAIYIILMTKKGERIMRPDFGCGLYKYMFAAMNYTTLKLMEGEVRDALLMWEPRIVNVKVSVDKDEQDAGRLNINISYVVRNTNNPYNLVYPYFLNEGITAPSGNSL